MSPASSGALEVERYIGACLISSQNRSKANSSKSHRGRDQFFSRERYVPEAYHRGYVDNLYQRCHSSDGWAGGMPLICFANYQQRGRRQDLSREFAAEKQRNLVTRSKGQSNPLARLAVHTQGAPLILANRYDHRKNKPTSNFTSPAKGIETSKAQNCKDGSGCDTVSVASDESSGSSNSENCLPRIIKPRKRRKKDRKPPHLVRPTGQEDCFSTDSASPDIDSPPAVLFALAPYVPFNYSYRPITDNFSTNGVNVSRDANKNSGDVLETPNLHHSFEDVEELVDGERDVDESSCQCRYCDPSGLIWDVGRHCYSPFLTSPENSKSFDFPEITVDSLVEVVENYNTPLSPEFIERLSAFSITDYGEHSKTQQPVYGARGDLEVSTEIVTSHNGHRDIEIKFFSAALPEDSNKTVGIEHRNKSFRDVSDCDTSDKKLPR